MNPPSLRTRITLLATLIVGTALTLAALTLAAALKTNLQHSALNEADRKLRAAATAVQHGPADHTGQSPDPDLKVNLAPPTVTGPHGAKPPDTASGRRIVALGDRFATATQVVGTDGGTATVQVRVSMEPTRQALALLHRLLLFGVPALVLLVAALTWYLTGKVLAPVASIRATFADITVKDLNQRVPVPRTRDEIARLAHTMNATLDRLETTVHTHKRFVADAAHELRSPIATLRTRLELGARQAPTLATEALADVTRIQHLATDLLLLARLDAGEPLRLEEVDLAQLAAEAAQRPTKPKIVLDLQPDVVVPGSPRHMARLVTNLVDNAARHATSTVTIKVTPQGLDVIDDGPGIPQQHREAVFDRFTRLDEARTRDTGGSGLGLAIARDIATAHGATLTVNDSPNGAHLSLRVQPPPDTGSTGGPDRTSTMGGAAGRTGTTGRTGARRRSGSGTHRRRRRVWPARPGGA